MRRWAMAVGRRLVHIRARRLAARFDKLSNDCRQTQADVLRRLLTLNAGTRFQSNHGLDPTLSSDEFRRRLPIATYADMAPYIEAVKQGETDALLGHKNRLLMFALSSGTAGDCKFIPVTRPFLNDYRRGWNIWAHHAFQTHPATPAQPFFQSLSNCDRLRTPSGVPCGNISGLIQMMQPRAVRNHFVLPREVVMLQDAVAKQYLTVLLGLSQRNVGMITTANPSTLVQLAKTADAERDRLIRDIHDGRLSLDVNLPDAVHVALRSTLSPQKDRAAELAAIVERTGHLWPRDFWPNRRLLAVWTGGSAAAYLPEVGRLYGDVPIRDHGLSASEGRMTIPIADDTATGMLDVASHFFEFIPESQAALDAPETLLAHELIEGQNYFILLTTASGLYRYNISDVVRCTGFVGTTPLLEFLHKGAHISNLTGEKLTESQVVAAVTAATEQIGCRIGHYTVCPVWGDPPAYHLLIEQDALSAPTEADRLAALVERHLQDANCEYREKRGSARLSALTVDRLPTGTWARYSTHRQQQPGASIEQYKHPCLKPDLTFRDELQPFVDADPQAHTLQPTSLTRCDRVSALPPG